MPMPPSYAYVIESSKCGRMCNTAPQAQVASPVHVGDA
jgi:hypothetical protein